MGSEAERAAALPGLRASLRESFAREVDERLPRLEALLESRAEGTADVEPARRDAHTLASSAWVVEEMEISRLARAVEQDLQGGPLADLVSRLRAWTP